MNLWNIKDLSMPPINTYKVVDRNNIDLKHLRRVFREGKQFFDNENHMSAEFAILSRIVYRMKQKFRSAKDFKALEKVHKALDNYFNTKISLHLKRFMNLIPSEYNDETYLPNKNILDYILVRLQGLVKILERIVETCKITAYLFDKRIHTGHFWKIGFIIFSAVSRIYVLAKCSTKFICEFYNKVLPFSRQLRNNGRNFLPENYVLPSDLQQWMNVNWLDIDDELQIIEMPEPPSITQFFDLVDDDDDIQFCNEYIVVNDENEEDIELIKEFKNLGDIQESIHKLRGFDIDEDVGEIIEVNDDSFLVTASGKLEGNMDEHEIDISNNTLQADVEESTSSNFGEVINIDDSLCNDKECDEVISLDRTLSDSRENSFDINEVIELSDSPKKNKNLQNGDLDNSIVNPSLIITEDILKPKTEDTNQVTNNNFKNGKKMSLTLSSKINETGIGESDTENVITISDSSMVQEVDAEKRLAKKKQLKSKKDRNRNGIPKNTHQLTTSLLELNKNKISVNISKKLPNDNKVSPGSREIKKKMKRKKNKEVASVKNTNNELAVDLNRYKISTNTKKNQLPINSKVNFGNTETKKKMKNKDMKVVSTKNTSQLGTSSFGIEMGLDKNSGVHMFNNQLPINSKVNIGKTDAKKKRKRNKKKEDTLRKSTNPLATSSLGLNKDKISVLISKNQLFVNKANVGNTGAKKQMKINNNEVSPNTGLKSTKVKSLQSPNKKSKLENDWIEHTYKNTDTKGLSASKRNKKKKLTHKEPINVDRKSEFIRINSEVTVKKGKRSSTQLNGAHKNKSKPLKYKKKKLKLKNAVQYAQHNGNLKHIVNKVVHHSNREDFKTKDGLRKKKKRQKRNKQQ